jgi:CO/xanthine dehydrogenase Mo-binding subunit
MASEAAGIVARWDGPHKLTVWLSTQSANMDRLILCSSLGPSVDVEVKGGPCGGSFGNKSLMYWQLLMQTILLAEAAKRPVKMCLTKEEQLATSVLRLASHFQAKVGMKKDGTVTAVSGNWIINTGSYSCATQGQIAVGLGEIQLLLRCRNWNLKTKLVCSNRSPSGVVRGFGGQELKAALAPVLHLAMEKTGIDPLEFYKKNWVKPGDGYLWRDSDWNVCRSVDYRKAMEKGAKLFEWEKKWKGWLTPTAIEGSKRFGVGVGVHGNADAGEDVSEAYVRLDPAGRAMIYSSVCEHGTGQRTNLCKMVAEVLQLPMERINITPPEPALSPFEFGAAGSRGTYAIGSAFISAAEDAKSKLLQYGAKVLQSEPENLDTADGMIYAKNDPGKRISWRGALGIDHTCLGYGRFEPDYTMPNFMIIFVEAGVDVDTGKVSLVRIVAGTDVGQIIDPLALTNQLYGSLGTAGIDSATFEETVFDPVTGRILGANMLDYKWRTFEELPIFETAILETPFPSHRFQAIGVGEITTAPGPSAVLMAVSNAIGTRLRDYPITPNKVLSALGAISGAAA